MTFSFRKLCLVALLLCAVVASSHAATKSRKRKPARTAPQKTAITPAALHGKVLFARDGSLWIVDPNTRRERLLVQKPFGYDPWDLYRTGISVSPDAKSVVVEHRPTPPKGETYTGSELWGTNLISKKVEQLTSTGVMRYSTEPHFSPDGKQIVYTRRSGDRMGGPGFTGMEIRLMNADGNDDRKVIGDISDLGQSYFGAQWSDGGKRLVFTHYIGNIDYDGEGRNKREIQSCKLDGTDVQPFTGSYSEFSFSAVSPNGLLRSEVVTSNGQTSMQIWNNENKSTNSYVLPGRGMVSHNRQWTNDGTHVVFDIFQTSLSADKAGRAKTNRISDVWSIRKDAVNLRRLATNAALIAVLP